MKSGNIQHSILGTRAPFITATWHCFGILSSCSKMKKGNGISILGAISVFMGHITIYPENS